MKQQLTCAAMLAVVLALTACAKSENAATTTTENTETAAVVAQESVSAEQQAAIDSIDQPILDSKNTDVPSAIANAPAEIATPDETAVAASTPVSP